MIKTIDKEIERQQECIKEKSCKNEVRGALPDGTSKFQRPMPGAARMYPETDVPLLKISRELINEVKKQLPFPESIAAAEKGYNSEKEKFNLKKLPAKISITSGSKAISEGAINSNIDLYIAYPMTPATGVLHELAGQQEKHRHMVFQAENEIAVVNSALGASFAGARTMVGTSGGGFDLMSEALSLQGQSEIPLVVYLASRPGPGTGVPTYTSQGDLDIALRAGHGEFPRIVIAPGDPTETIEKTNEAFYLAEKFNTLSIVLSDKHLAESEFSSDRNSSWKLQSGSPICVRGQCYLEGRDKF